MKKVAILGSTGSIGTQALDIIEKNSDKFQVEVLSCKKRIEKLEEQIDAFKPSAVVVSNETQANRIREKYKNVEVLYGKDGLAKVTTSVDYDILLNALVGISGLEPTYKAIDAGKDIALANKETLVAGGEIIMKKAKSKGVKIFPVDSEHSAIFQCLEGYNKSEINKILLTASGGPFRGKTINELKKVTLEEALKHPNWNMGSKITIDSATMMNKGLEAIEAKWLFDIEMEKIEILVHPQSIVHSGVEYKDGSVIAQMGVPDMSIPISLAISYPNRISGVAKSINFFNEGANLTFEKVDKKTFKCIELAYKAAEHGGSYPVVLNAANEILVEKFLKKEIQFLDIQNTLERVLEEHNPKYNINLEEILNIDSNIRKTM